VIVGAGDLLQEQLGLDDLEAKMPTRMPKSWSRIITGFAVPHLLPVRAVATQYTSALNGVPSRLPALEIERTECCRCEQVFSGTEGIAELAEIDEPRDCDSRTMIAPRADFLVSSGTGKRVS
jgi:hypothetical protein